MKSKPALHQTGSHAEAVSVSDEHPVSDRDEGDACLVAQFPDDDRAIRSRTAFLSGGITQHGRQIPFGITGDPIGAVFPIDRQSRLPAGDPPFAMGSPVGTAAGIPIRIARQPERSDGFCQAVGCPGSQCDPDSLVSGPRGGRHRLPLRSWRITHQVNARLPQLLPDGPRQFEGSIFLKFRVGQHEDLVEAFGGVTPQSINGGLRLTQTLQQRPIEEAGVIADQAIER